MNNLLLLLGKDAIKVAQLERIYAANSANQDFAADAIRAMQQLDSEVAWRAVWLLKRLAQEHRLGETDLVRLAQRAEEMTHWAARLNLCQLFATTGCPASVREALYPYLVDCFANQRPMIRAWAIAALVEFQSIEEYRTPIRAMLRQAQADPAGSIQARLRRMGEKRREPNSAAFKPQPRPVHPVGASKLAPTVPSQNDANFSVLEPPGLKGQAVSVNHSSHETEHDHTDAGLPRCGG